VIPPGGFIMPAGGVHPQ